ncbi:MAG: aldose 1-epimerase family protein [Acidothermaceae bacterium]
MTTPSPVAEALDAADHRLGGPSPSGLQYRISYGEQRATITEVGAAIREYVVAGRDVFQSYREDEFSQAYHGAVLLPWPNRIRDGRYTFDGVDYQLPITEPDRMTALHGLSPWRSWSVVQHDADRIVLSLRLLPSIGYPFHLDSEIEYALGPEGLRVSAKSMNVGRRPLPYGIAFHPYLSGGGALLDECVVRIDACRRIVSDERLLPVGTEDVTGTVFDFRHPHRLGTVSMDDAFTAIPRGADGRGRLSVTGPDGRTASVWSEPSCPYWQVFTGDSLLPRFYRRGMAAEPMSAAPDAFNSGDGLVVLGPGESTTTTWGAALT